MCEFNHSESGHLLDVKQACPEFKRLQETIKRLDEVTFNQMLEIEKLTSQNKRQSWMLRMRNFSFKNITVKNKKTQNDYIILRNAIDATNQRDGQQSTIYIRKSIVGYVIALFTHFCKQDIYVRESKEFIEKFEV